MLYLLEQLHAAIPLMTAIWEFSAAAAGGRDAVFAEDMRVHDGLVWNIETGRLTEEDMGKMVLRPPPWMKGQVSTPSAAEA